MLIGYYVGKVQHEEIFDDLVDEARFASPNCEIYL